MRKVLESTLFTVGALLAPAEHALLTVVALCLVDMVTGIMAARKHKHRVTSTGLKRTLIKLFVYEIAIVCAFLTGKYLTGELIPVMNIIAGFIGVTELKSVMENLSKIQGSPILTAAVDQVEKILAPDKPKE